MTNCQMQLEQAVGVMSLEIGIIKQLLERLLVPQALTTTKGVTAVKKWRTEQQAAKPTTRGKVALGRYTNSQQVPQSQAESTHSAAPNSNKTHTKTGPSRPYNGMVSGLPSRFMVPQGSQEKERTGVTPKSSHNVFDQLGQNAEEDLHAYLGARRTSTPSKKNNVLAFSPVHDEINDLRKRLDKLAAKSSETTPFTTRSSFNLEIQQTLLPTRFHMATMTTYKGKTTILTPLTTGWTCVRSRHEHGAGPLQSH